MLATKRAHESCVSLLLNAHADPNLTATPGVTPLTVARKALQHRIVQQLLDAGAVEDAGKFVTPGIKKPEVKQLLVTIDSFETCAGDSGGFTVYNISVKFDSTAWLLTKRFSEFKSFYAEVKEQLPPACPFPNLSAYVPRALHSEAVGLQRKVQLQSFVNALLHSRSQGNGADMEGAFCTFLEVGNQADTQGNQSSDADAAPAEAPHPPLFAAVESDQCSKLELLIMAGADVGSSVAGGLRPIHVAAQKGFAGCLELLIKASKQIEIATDDGRTAFWLATESGRMECVAMLCDAGADVNCIAGDGTTALHVACRSAHVACVELLLAKGMDVNTAAKNGYTAVHEAAHSGNLAILKLLINSGADLACVAATGEIAAVLAARNGHLDLFRLLLPASESDDSELQPELMASLLISVASNGHRDCMREILERGALVNTKGEGGVTPLYAAARNGQQECVQLLLTRGAQMSVADDGTGTQICISSHGSLRPFFAARFAVDCIPQRSQGLCEAYPSHARMSRHRGTRW